MHASGCSTETKAQLQEAAASAAGAAAATAAAAAGLTPAEQASTCKALGLDIRNRCMFLCRQPLLVLPLLTPSVSSSTGPCSVFPMDGLSVVLTG